MIFWRHAHAQLKCISVMCICSTGGVHILNWSMHAPCYCMHASVYGYELIAILKYIKLYTNCKPTEGDLVGGRGNKSG